MKTPESRRIAVTLVHRALQGDDAPKIAESVCAAWREIEAALAPVIGQRGVVALFERSLYLTRAAYPWLGGMQEGVEALMDLPGLKAVLAQQGARSAAAAGGDLLQAFHELLGGLIGPSLTEQLLRAAWANSFSGPAAQEPFP